MRRLRDSCLALLAVLVVAPPASAWSWPLGERCSVPTRSARIRTQRVSIEESTSPGRPARPCAPRRPGSCRSPASCPCSGRTVTIQTDGYAVSLTHLGEITVAKGAAVAEGDAVGVAGQSGEVEWPTPYVHLGIRVSSAADGYVDPATLLPPRAVAPPPCRRGSGRGAVAGPGRGPGGEPRSGAAHAAQLRELLRARPWARERPLHRLQAPDRRPAPPHLGMPSATASATELGGRRRLRPRRLGRPPAQHGRQERPERQQLAEPAGQRPGPVSASVGASGGSGSAAAAPMLCRASRASRPAPATLSVGHASSAAVSPGVSGSTLRVRTAGPRSSGQRSAARMRRGRRRVAERRRPDVRAGTALAVTEHASASERLLRFGHEGRCRLRVRCAASGVAHDGSRRHARMDRCGPRPSGRGGPRRGVAAGAPP